jgi:hypothetical protein
MGAKSHRLAAWHQGTLMVHGELTTDPFWCIQRTNLESKMRSLGSPDVELGPLRTVWWQLIYSSENSKFQKSHS